MPTWLWVLVGIYVVGLVLCSLVCVSALNDPRYRLYRSPWGLMLRIILWPWPVASATLEWWRKG